MGDNRLGESAGQVVKRQRQHRRYTRFHTIPHGSRRGRCQVHVRPSAFPVEAEVVVDRKGQFERKTAFYVRLANGTREIGDPVERQRYIAARWTAPAA
jgi:hypothetical protein